MRIKNKWDQLLNEEYHKEYFKNLEIFIESEYQEFRVFPTKENIFNALKLCDYDKVKAVIIGQDPYPNPGHAHGIAFSVQDGVKFPPSLKNIFKELSSDLGIETPISGNLTKWAEEGVLLLNKVLTVRENETNSHKGKGWEHFTNKIISILNEKNTPIVFILWGNDARFSKKLITNPLHLVLEGTHPSPLSCYRGGFFNGKYFSKCNQFLKDNGINTINWNLGE